MVERKKTESGRRRPLTYAEKRSVETWLRKNRSRVHNKLTIPQVCDVARQETGVDVARASLKEVLDVCNVRTLYAARGKSGQQAHRQIRTLLAELVDAHVALCIALGRHVSPDLRAAKRSMPTNWASRINETKEKE